MKSDAVPATPPSPGFFQRALTTYHKQTGLSFGVWAVVSLLNFAAQIVLRHELNSGEFGTMNTALGVLGLMTIPPLALNQAFSTYSIRPISTKGNLADDEVHSAAFLATETLTWVWGAVCFLLVFLLLPFFSLPRFSLELFTLMNVLISLGGIVSFALSQERGRLAFWARFLIAFAGSRALLSGLLGWKEPWAESGLAAFLLAGFITLAPALAFRETELAARWKACQTIWNRNFLLYAGATLSVCLGVFLFSSADRIVAQSWFGTARNNNMGLVDWRTFDAYQTAGLLGRGLVWGAQPLLWILFAQRAILNRTTKASLTFFWIYLGTLVAGAFVLGASSRPVSWLFCGPDYQPSALFVPSFAAVMVLLGLLQGVGIFSLASRRYPECFVFGACALAYTLMLYVAGRQPQSMLALMFGGGLISLMIVLFVGVVRWGRKQP